MIKLINKILMFLSPFDLLIYSILVFSYFLCLDSGFLNLNDNYIHTSPLYYFNYQSLIENFKLPEFIHNIFLGHNHTVNSQAGTLFFPMYIVTYIARLISEDDMLPLYLLYFLCLIVSSYGVNSFLNSLKINKNISKLCSIIWISTPYLFAFSNRWIFLIYTSAYFPWLLYFLNKLNDSPTLKNTLILVLIKFLYLCSGHLDYFYRTSIFELLYFIFFLKKNIPIYKYYSISFFVFFVQALPVISPILKNFQSFGDRFHNTFDVEYFVSGSINSLHFIAGQFLYYYNQKQTYNNLFQCGIPLGILIIIILYCIILNNHSRYKVFFFFSILSIGISSEFMGFVINQIPILNFFKHNGKFVFFYYFFSLIFIACILNVLNLKNLKKINTFLVLVIISQNILIYQFIKYHKEFAYKVQIDSKLLNDPNLKSNRIILLSDYHCDEKNYVLAELAGNRAILKNLNLFGGYANLVYRDNLKAVENSFFFSSFNFQKFKFIKDKLKDYSVKWVIKPNCVNSKLSLNKFGFTLYAKDKNYEIYENNTYLPFISINSDEINYPDYEISGDTIKIYKKLKDGDNLYINSIYDKNLYLQDIDNPSLIYKPINYNGKFKFVINKDINNPKIKYNDNLFRLTFILSMISLFISFIIIFKQ